MEKRKKHIVLIGKRLFVLLLIFTVSCEEPVELDLEETETKVVINCLFTPGEYFEAFISKSLFPNSEKFSEYPTDVEVQIYKGNEVLETLWPISSQGKYPFFSYQSVNIKPEVGVEYTIRANLPKFEKVSASSTIPTAIEIEGISISNIKKEYPTDQDSTVIDYVFDIAIQIKAAEGLPTYHHLDIYYERISYFIDQSSDTIRTYTGEYPSLELNDTDKNLNGLKHYAKGILIKQERAGNLVLNFSTRTPSPVFSDQDIFDKLYIDLRTVSKDYYLYQTKLTRQYEYDGDVLNDLNDPVLLHNNVNNGYGIFAGYSLSRDSVFVHSE